MKIVWVIELFDSIDDLRKKLKMKESNEILTRIYRISDQGHFLILFFFLLSWRSFHCQQSKFVVLLQTWKLIVNSDWRKVVMFQRLRCLVLA